MKLKALLRGFDIEVKGSKEVAITGISSDSKKIAPGNLFLAKKGEKFDGAQFIPVAIRAGAAAIATDLFDPTCPIPQLIISDFTYWEPKLASRFFGNPSKELFVVGVTGTKGKTTSSYLVWHVLHHVRGKGGLIGTVEAILGDEHRDSSLTTHFPIQNQKFLREMVLKGCKSVALEVSSHGLTQNRVGEIDFDMAIFTNLYPDHLDFHKTLEEYANAKKGLFERLDSSPKKKKLALFNSDSPWTSFMKEGMKSPHWTFGIENKAVIQASDIYFDGEGTTFTVSFQSEKESFKIPLIGRFNVYNALSAIGVGLFLGTSLKELALILATFEKVPGRLECFKNKRGAYIFVDYAHNEESLYSALQTLKEIAKKKMIVVFGCGGNRDPARRSGMARAAEKWGDVVVATSDNPRSEDPQEILRQIVSAFQDPKKVFVEVDRKKGIEKAISMAGAEDFVLIAGKGHEKTQVFAHHTTPFDDVQIAKEFDF